MINEYTGQVHLIITNILGRTVKQHTLYKNSEIYCTQIDLGELAAGSYLMLIQYGTGKEVHRIAIGN
jgi:hypothetical protein